MLKKDFKKFAQDILDIADVRINGKRPWDLVVHDERFYDRVMSEGILGLGESYMDGYWDAEQLDELFFRLNKADLARFVRDKWRLLPWAIGQTLFNNQKNGKSFNIGEKHYDIGNDLFRVMLDKRLTYTCGYWAQAKNLDDAQEAKLDLVCRKINLKPGQRILDIGCGWGSFAKFAAEKYQASVVGVTVSKEQVELAKQLCHGLPVEIMLKDYRDVEGKFDHIVSLGMFEHVGYKNYKTYMSVVQNLLKDDGLFLLHTIGSNISVHKTDPWLGKYIFPDSMLPSIAQIGWAMEDIFIMEDWHNFSVDYDKTLMAWLANFQAGWQDLENKYSQRFYRMWVYYLNICAAGFRARKLQLWQIVLSKKGVPGGYVSVR